MLQRTISADFTKDYRFRNFPKHSERFGIRRSFRWHHDFKENFQSEMSVYEARLPWMTSLIRNHIKNNINEQSIAETLTFVMFHTVSINHNTSWKRPLALILLTFNNSWILGYSNTQAGIDTYAHAVYEAQTPTNSISTLTPPPPCHSHWHSDAHPPPATTSLLHLQSLTVEAISPLSRLRGQTCTHQMKVHSDEPGNHVMEAVRAAQAVTR